MGFLYAKDSGRRSLQSMDDSRRIGLVISLPSPFSVLHFYSFIYTYGPGTVTMKGCVHDTYKRLEYSLLIYVSVFLWIFKI